MPHASYRTTVDSTFERLSDLLVDKEERPKKYIGAIQWSRVLERGDGYIVREMYTPAPVDLLVREKIYHQPVPDGEEFVYEHVDHPRYTGQVRNILTRLEGREDQCQLEYRMEWEPRNGHDPLDDQAAHEMMRTAVEQMKDVAEHPVDVPDWVRSYFASVDVLDAEGVGSQFADDGRFRFGNGGDVLGREAVTQLNREVFTHFASMKHHFARVAEAGNRAYVETYVEYGMPTGEIYLLPMITTIDRRDDGKVTDVNIYGDTTPLREGWPAH